MMTITASNQEIVTEQRDFLFGLGALSSVDIANLVAVAQNMRSDQQFNDVIRTGYTDFAAMYGGLYIEETNEFYNRLRQNNGGGFFNGKLPGEKETYSQRRSASIDVNAALKHSADVNALRDRLMKDIVKNTNEYSYATVGFLGMQDSQFVSLRRVPRADACAYCRLKAYEFSPYGDELADVELHRLCRCVAAPGFKFTDQRYLDSEAQELFNERLEKLADQTGYVMTTNEDMKDLLMLLREDFKYH